MKPSVITVRVACCCSLAVCRPAAAQTYPIVDTAQELFFNNSTAIPAPDPGGAFSGQDAGYTGNAPAYRDNGDGTVTDLVTGLMWQKSPDRTGEGLITAADKVSFSEAMAEADDVTLAGYDDWRLPSIKELYSLIVFSGLDPSGWNSTNTDNLVPFIDTRWFDFGYGDVTAGERIIDAQFASSTQYVSTTMNGDETMFGVNFADGRIKGYPTGPMPGSGESKRFYVLYVRGNPSYGVNDFHDNGDGTVSDVATGLMWQKSDSETGMNWQEALAWVEEKNSGHYRGYSDWRLPNVKELQSIVDYTRSPATSGSAAIDPIFTCSRITDEGGNFNYPFYWSGTTHESMAGGSSAAYVAFGEALGWMEMPPYSGNYMLMDVHGAGAQRSDPKSGDPASYPYGHGPQGDVIRIYNYVRCVRDIAAAETAVIEQRRPGTAELARNYPNPFNPLTTIPFTLSESGRARLSLYDIQGRIRRVILDEYLDAGGHRAVLSADGLSSGSYIYRLVFQDRVLTGSCTLLR
ncbi:DUF1566 domain-containing protein [bacterium]|nr:DUF1566 domain-containing protein [bacterium]